MQVGAGAGAARRQPQRRPPGSNPCSTSFQRRGLAGAAAGGARARLDAGRPPLRRRLGHLPRQGSGAGLRLAGWIVLVAMMYIQQHEPAVLQPLQLKRSGRRSCKGGWRERRRREAGGGGGPPAAGTHSIPHDWAIALDVTGADKSRCNRRTQDCCCRAGLSTGQHVLGTPCAAAGRLFKQ